MENLPHTVRESESVQSIAAKNPSKGRADLLEGVRAGCKPCKNALTLGWWGHLEDGALTHCSGCHRNWGSLVEGHCTSCHTHFVSPKAFDKHFLKDGSCGDVHTMERSDGKLKFTKRGRKYGDVWSIAFYGERPTHWG